MVDPKDRPFREMLEQRVVERLSRFAIASKRLLDDQTGVDVEPAPGERRDHDAKQAGGNGKIVQRPFGAGERLLQFREGLRIVVVAVDISQEPQKLIELCGVSAPVLFDAVFGASSELLDGPAGFCDANDRHVDAFVAHETEEGREDLLEREIAGSAEGTPKRRTWRAPSQLLRAFSSEIGPIEFDVGSLAQV